MAILIPLLIPTVLLYLTVWWIGRNWPPAGVFICRFKYLFALIFFVIFVNSLYTGLERGQKKFGVGALSVTAAFLFLPSKRRFMPKKVKQKAPAA